MNNEAWWNNSNRRIPDYLERNLPYHYFVFLDSHINWPEMNPERPLNNCLSHRKEMDVASPLCLIFMQKITAYKQCFEGFSS
jgi:hypothetical protein